ncbi:hypothetical protein NC652_004823 [Populus alba x Populus x berolinensis]|nr:hypothetical protein NC652_004823 [Populus alba x Populus x berolinensis]
MYRATVQLVSLCFTWQVALSVTDGLLPNGDFEYGPKPSEMKGNGGDSQECNS